MGAHRSADEIRRDLVRAMGDELGTVFHALSNDLTWVHWKWSQYRKLYGEQPSRIELMNEAASEFFWILDSVLFEDAVLGLARLVAHPKSASHKQLTLRRLPPLVLDVAARDACQAAVDRAAVAAKFAVEWRDRHIAHRNLDLALDATAAPLAPASRQRVEDALATMRDVLNGIERVYCKSTTSYQTVLLTHDAESLLYVLRDGLARARDREAAWSRGESHADDGNPPV